MAHTQLNHRIAELSSSFSPTRENLLPFLELLDKEFSYLSDNVLHEAALIFGLSDTEVYSVASFYHLINTTPVGSFVLRLCRSITCELHGKDAIVSALESALGISMGETTEDTLFTLTYANCMGSCDTGPALLCNDVLYDNLTPAKVAKIIQNLREGV